MINNIYYWSHTRADKNKTGIEYKIYKQQSLFEEHIGIVKKLYVDRNRTFLFRLLSRLPFMNFNVSYDCVNRIESNSFIYIRYYYADFYFVRALKQAKKKSNVVIYLEIPTFPYDGELLTIKNFYRIVKDIVWRGQLHKYIDKVITYSDDSSIFKIPTIQLSNGVDTELIKKRNIKKHDDINIIAVAHIAFWHGYDRLICGLGEYYKKRNNNKTFKIYIVGSGDKKIIRKLAKMIKNYNLENYVFLTGEKKGTELEQLYDIADIGVDSLGRHRSHVRYNSSLKGKEYLAKGLPVISGVETELDKEFEFPYYLRVPADESPVDFYSIGKFYDQIYKNDEDVGENIRRFCEEKFDLRHTFMPIIDDVKQL